MGSSMALTKIIRDEKDTASRSFHVLISTNMGSAALAAVCNEKLPPGLVSHRAVSFAECDRGSLTLNGVIFHAGFVGF